MTGRPFVRTAASFSRIASAASASPPGLEIRSTSALVEGADAARSMRCTNSSASIPVAPVEEIAPSASTTATAPGCAALRLRAVSARYAPKFTVFTFFRLPPPNCLASVSSNASRAIKSVISPAAFAASAGLSPALSLSGSPFRYVSTDPGIKPRASSRSEAKTFQASDK